jgi:succinoglycan biosynthesis transport protein ExoP
MNLRQILEVLRARRKPFIVIFCLMLSLGIAAILFLPEKYKATAAVVVDAKSPDPISGMLLSAAMMPGYMATQIDVMTSERVAQKVIKATKLDEQPTLLEQWREDTDGKGSYQAWLSAVLLKPLVVTPARESNVIYVTYGGQSPEFAAVIANAFVQAYIDTTLELRVEPAKQFSKMFDYQSSQAKARVEKAQATVSQYQQQNGLLVTDERLDVENQRLSELTTQLVGVQGLRSDAANRDSQAGPNSPEVLASAVVVALTADLGRAEVQLKQLNSRYGPSHSSVVDAQAQIQELKNRIKAEGDKVAGSLRVGSRVAQQREAELKTVINAQREKLLRMKEQRDEVALLLKEVDSAQKEYDNIRLRLNQSSLESQSNQTNVNWLQSASPPAKASWPNPLIIIPVSILAGLFFGGMYALVREFFDRKIRVEDDLIQLSTLPLLVQLPKGKGNGRGLLPVASAPRIALRTKVAALLASK